eukprot:14844016-Alexandrium_andersonii.AAC.1
MGRRETLWSDVQLVGAGLRGSARTVAVPFGSGAILCLLLAVVVAARCCRVFGAQCTVAGVWRYRC